MSSLERVHRYYYTRPTSFEFRAALLVCVHFSRTQITETEIYYTRRLYEVFQDASSAQKIRSNVQQRTRAGQAVPFVRSAADGEPLRTHLHARSRPQR